VRVWVCVCMCVCIRVFVSPPGRDQTFCIIVEMLMVQR